MSLLLHLGLVYRYRAWQPSAKTLEELSRQQREEIPVQIVELPPKEKKRETPKPPPKKPTLLADRNEQSKTNTRTDASAPPSVRVKPKAKPQPAKPKPASPKPEAKPQIKPVSQLPKDDSAVAKPSPKEQAPEKNSPKKISPQVKKESPQESEKTVDKDPAKEIRPDIKKLFPSFEELTKNNRRTTPTTNTSRETATAPAQQTKKGH